MPIQLQSLLNVRELPPSFAKLRESLPSIRDFVCDGPAPYKDELVPYLKSGVVCDVHYDQRLLRDVFDPTKIIPAFSHALTGEEIDANCLMTDGHWVWAAALVYYVSHHGVSLPKHFIDHAISSDWRIPSETIDIPSLDTSDFDAIPSTSDGDTDRVQSTPLEN